jgi:hypothetical protein
MRTVTSSGVGAATSPFTEAGATSSSGAQAATSKASAKIVERMA